MLAGASGESADLVVKVVADLLFFLCHLPLLSLWKGTVTHCMTGRLAAEALYGVLAECFGIQVGDVYSGVNGAELQ
jgi:hypothetical protein